MTTVAHVHPLASLPLLCVLAACASDADGSSTTQDASSSSTDAPTSSEGSSADEDTTSAPGGSSGDVDSSSSGDVDSSSSSGGEPSSMDGRYALVAVDAAIEPAGCASDQGGRGDWFIELGHPRPDGTSTLHETFGPHANDFVCTSIEGGLQCSFAITVDYAEMGGVDAVVQLASSYAATWTDADGIAGDYDVMFSCEGTECADVHAQWSVEAFPCSLGIAFTGVQVDP